MKNTVFLILTNLLLIGCTQDKNTNVVSQNLEKNNIEGSWKLVYAHIKEQDSIQVKDLNKTEFIKIINESHFAFFDQGKGSDETFTAGGGTYTYDGEDYIETLDFINAPAYRGHVFPFKAEVKGDSLIQQGHEKIEEAGLDRYILEKYIRITKQQ
ncbi:hypothetical protein [Lutimonas sp.]|uniref:hypothetical protein n=1 Tax=Lutimonas sp. TaxID=1872403 RepID=UPI003D9B165D